MTFPPDPDGLPADELEDGLDETCELAGPLPQPAVSTARTIARALTVGRIRGLGVI
jgi:hypothetical protein